MGINISVRRVTGKTIEETWGVPAVYYETEEQDWFNDLRHSGDKEFVLNNEFYYIDSDLPDDEQRLARPLDFFRTRRWVECNVFEGNQCRLLEALEKMEIDESLCFTWSW